MTSGSAISTGPARSAAGAPVRTDSGLVSGTVPGPGAVACFKGIPYAAPPAGELRWRPPAPPQPWDGVRPATQAGPAPVQALPPRTSIIWHTNFADRRELVMSEDCLYLNVWTPEPAPGAALPVMVFLHGGGFRVGNGGQDVHDGASLASRGIVVVTVNMRLGALGFLAHPELAAEDELGASGNYGLLDVVAALHWVQRNIGNFGGDPGRVTLAGNSAGAAIVTHLMAADAARGLFRAAIGQSSSGIYRADGALPGQDAAQERGLTALGALGGLPLSRLRALSPAAFLLDAPLGVVIDGRVLTRDSEEVFSLGQQHPLPLLAGTTTDEATPYTPASAAGELRERVRRDAGGLLAGSYPAGEAELAASARAFVSETRFIYPVWRWARTHVATAGAPAWLYRFDHEPPLPGGLDLDAPPDGGDGYGVYHTSELPYTGDNLQARDWDWTQHDRELARVMGDCWAQFVTGCDPNGPGLPAWAAFDGSPDARVLVFGDSVRAEGVRRLAALEALDAQPRPW